MARLERAARALLIALALAFGVTVLGSSGSSSVSGRLGGDYPEFYAAGRIVRHGDADRLYDAATQSAAQRDLFNGDQTGYLDFAYPPVVALVYAPLSALPYRVSYALDTMLMVGLLVLALSLMRPMVEPIARHFFVSIATAIAFYPLFRAVTAGQNTAITIVLVAGYWRSRHDQRPVAAGLLLGGLLFKPQLAVLVLAAQLISARWRVLVGAATSGAALGIVSTIVAGPGWVSAFVGHARDLPGADAKVEGSDAVSLLNVAHHLLGSSTIATVLGAGSSILVGVWALVVWRRLDRRGDAVGLARGLGVLAAATVLVAPHVIFYDAGLLVVAGAALAATGDAAHRRALGWLELTALTAVAGRLLPINPLVVVAAVALVLAARAGGAERPGQREQRRGGIDRGGDQRLLRRPLGAAVRAGAERTA